MPGDDLPAQPAAGQLQDMERLVEQRIAAYLFTVREATRAAEKQRLNTMDVLPLLEKLGIHIGVRGPTAEEIEEPREGASGAEQRAEDRESIVSSRGNDTRAGERTELMGEN